MNPKVFKACDIGRMYPAKQSPERRSAAVLSILLKIWKDVADTLQGMPALRVRREGIPNANELLQCAQTYLSLCQATGISRRIQRQTVSVFVQACFREINCKGCDANGLSVPRMCDHDAEAGPNVPVRSAGFAD